MTKHYKRKEDAQDVKYHSKFCRLPKQLLEKLPATCGQGHNPVDRDLSNIVLSTLKQLAILEYAIYPNKKNRLTGEKRRRHFSNLTTRSFRRF